MTRSMAAGGNDTLVGGAGSDGYVYLVGDGDDVIIDLAGDPGFDELLLSGGIAPDDVGVLRLGERDLLLSLPAGSILVSGFFGGHGEGIERVVFDGHPAWTRADLELRALAIEPHLMADTTALMAADAPPHAPAEAHFPAWLEEHLPTLF